MDKRKDLLFKRKGFIVTKSDFNIVSKVCDKSVNNVKNIRNGFTVKPIDCNFDINRDLRQKNANNLMKSKGFVVNESQMNFNNEMNNTLNEINSNSNQSIIERNNKIMKKCLNNNNININTNNVCLLSDSKLHQLLPTLDWKPKCYEIIKENNLKVIKGKFSKEEKQILTNNWNKFCEDFNCDEDMRTQLLGFFYHYRSTDERRKMKEFIKRENFYLRLGKGLPNRTLFNIISQCRAHFCPLKRKKQLSEYEGKQIKSLYSIHGNKWSKIAFKLNCYPKTVEMDCLNNYNSKGEPYRRDKWSANEDKQLLNAMKSVLNTDDLTQHIFTKNIPYIKIKELSKLNRCVRDIDHHWKRHLRWSLTNFTQLEDNWAKSDSSKLIYCLYKYNFDNELDIDWDLIKEKFEKISSFNNLMKNWRIIKSTVLDFESKTYKQIINFLYDNFLPINIKTDEDLRELENFYQN